MLYIVLKRLIETGQTEGLVDKIDLFYAVSKLNDDEYADLVGMLSE